jgi:hypothetical protein
MTHKDASKRGRPAWGKLGLALLVVAALAAAWRFTPLSDYVTADRIAQWARAIRATPWAPVVVIVAYTPAAFIMFPRPLLTLLTVIAFGPWLGFAYGMTGILVSRVCDLLRGAAVQAADGEPARRQAFRADQEGPAAPRPRGHVRGARGSRCALPD